VIKKTFPAAVNYSKKKKRKLKPFLDIIIIISASILYSFGVRTFTLPNDIAPGGLTGISTIINYITDFPLGSTYGLLNLPLIVAGFVMLRGPIMFKTFLSISVITVCTDYLFAWLPVYTGDKILAALYGGAIIGISLGLIFSRDGTSGGIDIISRIIRKKMPYISIGRIIVVLDIIVVASAMLIFKSIDSGLYAIISIFISSMAVDLILYGALEGKMLLIFSDRYEDIASKIINEQKRGVTILKGFGGYSGQDKNVICCAVQKNQYAKIKSIVRLSDPSAFIIIANAREVLGEGFAENSPD
jgi:uncharacterized membrane-anchored protein YitT (DUF2179 family)